MKVKSLAAALICLTSPLFAQTVYETEQEFITSGDFNGDGKTDIAIVDRYTGRVRVGYRISAEFFNWANWKKSGIKGVTGVSVGKLVDSKYDSLALAAADANAIAIVSATSPNVESDPVKVPSPMLGPNAIVAIDIPGTDNTPLPDFYVASVYNPDPTPNHVTFYRNLASKFPQAGDVTVAGEEGHANRIALKSGGPEYVIVLSKDGRKLNLLAEKLDSGKPEPVLNIADVPKGSDYVVGNFSSAATKDVVFYVAGETNLQVATLTESGGQFKASPFKTITLTRPVRQLTTIDGDKKSRLLAVFGYQEPAEVLDFDGANAPVTVQKLNGATNKFLNASITLSDAVVLLSVTTNDRPRSVSHYQVQLLKDGKYSPGAYGSLASLADRDDSTVPDIQKFIVRSSPEKTEADMKTYTNMIPGTDVKYYMAAIKGGEFTMGSPDGEKGRQKDEGPQHKVKVSPFWMGQFEVTWDQYLLFMYSDDEKKLRNSHKTDAKIDEVSDAVTRPSKPYVDMSFGMGKNSRTGGIGFPAIAMTQHAASKFCHWLSAKTGHFYRLPTEAEWEYACRAGTTTAFYFGNDESQLKDYGWFFDNSNSKYQEVGKKKPNPWGLYDMYGNVTEWVLDQYDADFYNTLPKDGVIDPWKKATTPYPHSVRGGSWDDDAVQCRSAARRGSDRSWKVTDPQLPKSIWYLSDAQFVGFRIVRPLNTPSSEEMTKYWIGGVEKD